MHAFLASLRPHVLVLIVLTAGGAAARAAYLSTPMRYDEAHSFLVYASAPWRAIVETYDLPNNHVLHTLGMHFAWVGLGDAPWVLRLPAFLAGVGCIPAAYLLGREASGRSAGLWAAALVCGSSMLIQYSANGRGYSLATLLVLCGAACGAIALRTGRWAWWAGFAALATLALYTLPSAAIGIAVMAVWLAWVALARAPAGRRLRDAGPQLRNLVDAVMATIVAAVILYWPTLPDAGWRPTEAVVPTADTAAEKWRLVEDLWGLGNEGLPLLVRLGVLAGFLAAVVLHRRSGGRPAALAGSLLVALVAMLLVWDPPALARTLFALVPLYLVVAAIGLSWATDRLGDRLRDGRGAVGLAAPAAASIALLALFVARGDAALTIDIPRTDPGLVSFARSELDGQPLLVSSQALPSVAYEFRRAGTGDLAGPQPFAGAARAINAKDLRRGSVAIAAVNGVDRPGHLLAQFGLRPESTRPPRPLRRFRWVTVYEIRLAGDPRRGVSRE